MSIFRRSRTQADATGLDAGPAMTAQRPRAVAEPQVQGTCQDANKAPGLDPGPASPLDDELWSLKTVVARTALSRSSIYSYVELGLFPRQRRLGPRRVGWLASEVRAWIASRPL
jgi:prophage regulatory protein